jgi:hypothetical protein
VEAFQKQEADRTADTVEHIHIEQYRCNHGAVCVRYLSGAAIKGKRNDP